MRCNVIDHNVWGDEVMKCKAIQVECWLHHGSCTPMTSVTNYVSMTNSITSEDPNASEVWSWLALASRIPSRTSLMLSNGGSNCSCLWLTRLTRYLHGMRTDDDSRDVRHTPDVP